MLAPELIFLAQTFVVVPPPIAVLRFLASKELMLSSSRSWSALPSGRPVWAVGSCYRFFFDTVAIRAAWVGDAMEDQ